MFFSRDKRFRVVGQGTLVVEKLRVTDAGHYTCRATNSEDTTDATATLTVQCKCSAE